MVKVDRTLNRFIQRNTINLLAFAADERAEYSKEDHLTLLINASALNGFAEGTSNALNAMGKRVPNADTLLLQLKGMEIEEVRSQFDRRVEKFVRELGIDRPIPVAIDWHDVMYYGKATDMVIGTQHKDGSCHAYEFLTASILVDKQRLIIAVMPVDSRRGKLRLVKPILGRMKRLGLKIRYIAFDKGFLSNELLKYLEDEGIKYILHFPARKKTEGIERDSRIAYKTNNHRDYKNNLEFDLVCAYDEGEEREYLFATNLHYSPKRILDLFKSRWGIETGYRMANQFLIKTTSKNYGVRLCYYMFACLMYNCWVMYNFSKGHTTVIGIKLCLILSTALGVDNVIGSDYI